MSNKTICAIGSVLVLPAVSYGGYKLYQKYILGKSTEDESQSEGGEDKSTSRSADTENKSESSEQSETTEGVKKGSSPIVPLLLVLFVVAAAVYFLAFAEKEVASQCPEELPIG